MLRYVCLLVLACCMGAANVAGLTLGSKAVAEGSFLPDFAYPRDVMTGAKALLSSPGATGADTLLAAEAYCRASADLDRLSLPDDLRWVVNLADSCGSNAALRALLLAYAGQQSFKAVSYGIRGMAEPLSADSLFEQAVKVCPADVPLAVFEPGVVFPSVAANGLVGTVRDFVLMVASNCGLSVEFPAGSPLAVYKDAWRMSRDDLERYIRQNISAPGVEYACLVYLQVMGQPMDRVRELDFLNFMKSKLSIPWLVECIDGWMCKLYAEQWAVEVENNPLPGKRTAFKFIYANTGLMALKLTRSGNELKWAETAGEPKTLIRAMPSQVQPDTVMDYEVLKAGYYRASVNGREPVGFRVSPWRSFLVTARDGKRVLLVLDALTGLPACGVKVLTVRENGEEKKIGRTDKQGMVRIQPRSKGNLYLSDGKGLTLGTDIYISNVAERIITRYEKEDVPGYDDKLRWKVVLDRPAYHPGDTVRWVAVVQDNAGVVVEGVAGRVYLWKPSPGTPGGDNRIEKGVSSPTDAYGRTTGYVVLSADEILGLGNIQVGNGRAYFNVSDFKLPELSLTEVKYRVDNDALVITGQAINAAGAGVSGTQVNLACMSRKGGVYESVDSVFTAASGHFSIRVLKKKLANGFDEKYCQARLMAVTGSGYTAEQSLSLPLIYTADIQPVYPDEPIDVASGLNLRLTVTNLATERGNPEAEVIWRITEGSANDRTLLSGKGTAEGIRIAAEELKNIRAGYYCVILSSPGAEDKRVYVTLYNSTQPYTPDNQCVWAPRTRIKYDPSVGVINIPVIVAGEDTHVYWFDERLMPYSQKLSKGNDTIRVTLPVGICPGDIDFFAIKDGVSASFNITPVEEMSARQLILECISFRDKTVPGDTETWELKVTCGGKPVSAAVFANIYYSRLSVLGRVEAPAIYVPAQPSWYTVYGNLWRQSGYSNLDRLNNTRSVRFPDVWPSWKYEPKLSAFHIRGRGKAALNSSATGAVEMKMATADAYDKDAGPVTEESVADESNEEGSTTWLPLRGTMVYNALWAPGLVSDGEGVAKLNFTVPDQNCTWTLLASAWTADGRSAVLRKDFTAVKPVTVDINMPRYVRAGDTVRIITAVTNATDTIQQVQCAVKCGGVAVETDTLITGGHTVYIPVMVDVKGLTALDSVLVCTAMVSAGNYGDGERKSISILPSESLVTEARNFYLSASDSVYNFTVQADAAAENTLQFTDNPLWTAVQALPYFKDAQGTIDEVPTVSPELTRALYVALTALHMAEKHPVLQTYIDIRAARKDAEKYAAQISALQQADGGIRWGNWNDKAGMYSTLYVLQWLYPYKNNPLVSDMLTEALNYVDTSVESQMISAGRPGSTDIYFTQVRLRYGQPATLGARQLVENTIQYIRSNWKGMDLTGKCHAANALSLAGERNTAAMVLNSVMQHATENGAKGLSLNNMYNITDYATLLETLSGSGAAVAQTDAVRTHLIAERRGNTWGNGACTAMVIRALVESGTEWLARPGNVNLTYNTGQSYILNSATGSIAVDIPVGITGGTLSRESHAPAYGAVVSRRFVPVRKVTAFVDSGLSIAKTIEGTSGARMGQTLTVTLTVTCPQEMENVIITDQRPAALEPVEQVGRYMWNNQRTGYYLVNANTYTRLYVDLLPRGTSVFKYKVHVNNAGTFDTGVATVTCGVDTALTAHSGAGEWTVSN